MLMVITAKHWLEDEEEMTLIGASEDAATKHLQDHPQEATRKGELRVMGRSGDDKLTWDSDNPKQVLQARTAFDQYRSQGYRLYKTATVGGKKVGEPIDEFDPNIERMIAVPPMQGG